MASRYPVVVNGYNLQPMIERDSYQTSYSPVFEEGVTTMDKVRHTALVRWVGGVSFQLNPQTAEDTAALTAAFAAGVLTVTYHCNDRDLEVTANMTPDGLSAKHLSRCLHLGKRWNELGAVTLTEL